MHPCPIGRGYYLKLIYVLTDNEIWTTSRRTLGLRVWVKIQSAQGSIRLGEDRAIGYGYRVAHHGRPSESQEELPPPRRDQGEGGGGA